MRCKKHLHDLTSGVGVCATCLRERLEPIFEAQAQTQTARVTPRCSVSVSDDFKKPEPGLIGLNFPRSVSPYVSRRKSDRLFYSTPPVGSTFPSSGAPAPAKKRLGRFWILSNFFQSRSNKSETSSREATDPSPPSAAASSPSWLSTFLPGRRQNRRRDCEKSDRVTISTENTDFSGELDHSPPGNCCMPEESPQRRNHAAAAARRSRLGSAGKTLSGLVICLSPLVRAKGLSQELGAHVVVSGAHNNHISTAATLCPNRSRKLADFGRVNHNR
ncbi:hypothetical protein RIF29_18373 [Crotalaria pallida]|uniref:Uncharacterized protein n=1 Tax=Crotalaria pallida TaxID=3830 RepID=A0AAN9IFE6_CROPI